MSKNDTDSGTKAKNDDFGQDGTNDECRHVEKYVLLAKEKNNKIRCERKIRIQT